VKSPPNLKTQWLLDGAARSGLFNAGRSEQVTLPASALRRMKSMQLVRRLFCDELYRDERGQDIAEYAVMLAVILVIVVGTVRLIGSNANNVFSSVASSIQ
jgi:Flp pilus assembly pilin Flp